MKTVYKGMVSALTAAFLFSLCLTPIAFAEEEPSAAMLSEAEEAELPTATPSDAEEMEEELLTTTPSDVEEVDPLTATPSDAVADTVSTGEELMEWLSVHKDTGGTVKLADNISISDFYYARNMGAEAVTVDTGEFTIAVNGYVYLQATSPLKIRGAGGEQGLLRTFGTGSMLHLNGLDLEAEDGYAVFQEEGTGFILDTLENTSVAGTVHYAEQPFVWEWEPALAVVKQGETLDDKMLPAAISACINHNGTNIYPYEEVPVTWDLSGHGEDQKLRRRFAVTGEFEGMASQTAPGCTVVYDDFPLTFLEVNAVKMEGTYGDTYRLRGTFSKPEDRLPITVAQEYSFDGKNWTLYQEKTVTTLSSGFSITLFAGTEDLERYSELFIRLSWNDDGTMYYSNVLGFAMDSLEVNEEPGGNRGGGTDIIDPPKQPEPDPEPETTPPEASEPETTPPPVTSSPTPDQPGNSGADHEPDGGGKGPSHGLTQKPDLPGGSSEQEAAPSAPVSEPPESTVQISAVKDETPEDMVPVIMPETRSSADGASAPFSRKGAEVLAEPEPESAPPKPDALTAVAGLAAVAACVGGAALYLHIRAYPGASRNSWLLSGRGLCAKVWKELQRKLRNISKR